MRRHALPWAEVERLTTDPALADDPAFARIPAVGLRELLGELPDPSAGGPLTLVVGPGAALVPHDLLWWLDLPKADSLAAVRRGQASNLGQPPGEIGTEKRLLFVDWPLLDRHKRAHAHRLDRLVDVTDPTVPRSLTGDSLRASLSWLSGRPFRTRPTFLPGPWGGQWLRTALGIETDETNLAWSYELITPESGILLGDGPTMEVGFELLLAAHPERVLGTAVAERFGATFPIRFDYLDTMEGGHLSVQCHPGERYARETFGLDYTQEETYYVMATTPGGSVFLGLREDADVDAFRARRRARRVRGRRVRSGSLPGTAPGRAPSPLPDSARDAACERRRQRRARDKRNAVPLHPSLLRLASSRRRRTAPSGSRRPRLREPRPQSKRSPRRGTGSCPDGGAGRARLEGAAARSPSGTLLRRAPSRLRPTRSRTTRGAASTSSISSRATASRSRPRRETSTRCRSPRRSSSRPPWGRTGCGASAGAAARS